MYQMLAMHAMESSVPRPTSGHVKCKSTDRRMIVSGRASGDCGYCIVPTRLMRGWERNATTRHAAKSPIIRYEPIRFAPAVVRRAYR
jgi:hypothetical protein